MKENPELITLAEAARLRGVSADSVRKLIRRGRVRSVSVYGRVLVYRDEVLAFERKSPGPAKGTKKGKATKKGK